MTFPIPYDLETDILRRKQVSDAQLQNGLVFDPATVGNIQSFGRDYPWLEPGAAVAFAQSGYDSGTPGVHQVAQLSLGRQLRERQVAQKLGRQLQAAERRAGIPELGNAAIANLPAGQLRGLLAETQGTYKAQHPSLGQQFGAGLAATGEAVSRAAHGDIRGAIEGKNTIGPNPGVPLPGGGNTATVAKGVVRTAALAAQTPLQEGQGFVRNAAEGVSQLARGNFGEVFNPASSTNVNARETPVMSTQSGQAAQALLEGRNVDVGSGFLPDPNSATGKAAADVARTAAPTIGGHAWTVGRAFASGVGLEPDSTGFNALSGVLDATLAWKGDPANALISGFAETRNAGRFFSPEPVAVNMLAADTGLVASSVGPHVIGQTRTAFLDSPDTQTTLAKWAGMNAGEAWYASNKQLPAEMAAAIGKAKTPEEVRAVLDSPVFQPRMMPNGFLYNVKQSVPDSKMFATTTARMIAQPNDPNTFLPQLDKYLIEAGLPKATRTSLLDGYLAQPDRGNALIAAGNAVEETALAHGARPDVAKAVGRIIRNTDEGNRAYALDQITGGERVRPGVVIDGTGNVLPSPELMTERLNSGVWLPDPREVRRATSRLAPIFTSKPWSKLMAAPELFMEAWRPLHIGRPALTLRILADTQADLAANGYDSLFNGGAKNVIASIVGANLDKTWGTKLDKIVEGKYVFGPGGEEIIPHLAPGASLDVRQAALDNQILNRTQHAFSAYEEPGKIVLNDFVPVSRSDERAASAMVAELGRMRGDPILQGLAQQASPEAAKEWFATGAGARLREQFQPIADNADALNATKASAIGGTHVPYGDLSQRANSDALVTSMLDSLAQRTGNHPDLIDAVRTGKIGDTPIWRYNGPNAKAEGPVQAIFDQGGGPNLVKARRSIQINQGRAGQASGWIRYATQKWMNALLTVPDRTLNQIPGWSQANWREAEKYVPWLDRTAIEGKVSEYEKFLSDARDANLPDSLYQRIANIGVDASSTERLTQNELAYLAKADAVQKMSQLTHNIGSRSNFFDTFRFLVPFGDAFRLIATRWLATINEHPNVLRRAEQLVQGAQQSGFFHKDPTTGEDVFTYPGSQYLTDKLVGVPIPLTGQVKGLSILGEGYPGIGPGVTMPATWFLPDTPQFDGIRKIIFPYGQPESKGIAGDIAQNLMPPWLDKMISGPPDQKTYNNTVGYMMDYLASTGKYDLHGPKAREELARLASDAKDKARWFYVIRGATQAVTPSAPAPQWLVHDKTGHLAVLQVIKNDYNSHLTKDGPDTALQWLIDNYGENNVFAAQSFSNAIGYAVPTTAEGQAWARANPQAQAKYPTTYGLFAPSRGKFDITAFENQFTTGERKSLTPAEQTAQAENRVGQWIYYRMRDQIIAANNGRSLDQAQSDWLAQYKEKLAENYPGFDSFLAQPYDNQKRRNTAIQELIAGSKDAKLAKTDAGQGLVDYLGFRQQAIDQSRSDGYRTPFQAQALASLRQWLRDAGNAIIARHPDFRPMFEQVWDNEMRSDVVAQ